MAVKITQMATVTGVCTALGTGGLSVGQSVTLWDGFGVDGGGVGVWFPGVVVVRFPGAVVVAMSWPAARVALIPSTTVSVARRYRCKGRIIVQRWWLQTGRGGLGMGVHAL